MAMLHYTYNELRSERRVLEIEIDSDDLDEIVSQAILPWLGTHPAAEIFKDMEKTYGSITVSVTDRDRVELMRGFTIRIVCEGEQYSPTVRG